ncbi:hypothetical protein LWI28_017607 [Acer negundo]|uniref:Transposase (putative) gypsy type domain-containing protein n=1 Tax=Acer negundo TaxID=4023 RepID=A0AAD5IM48_ACENE|nr:hypothetical protein LWI28_017607 [Acer negundo]
MVRNVTASRVDDFFSSSESLEGSSERSSTRSVFEARGSLEGDEPEIMQPGVSGGEEGRVSDQVDSEVLLLGREGHEASYNSKEYFRYDMDHMRFIINHVGGNKLNVTRISQIAKEFSISDTVGMRMPLEGEKVSNPNGVSVAFHPAFLEIGARLPFHPYASKVLYDFMLASAQLNPNGWRIMIGMYSLWRNLGFSTLTFREIAHCYIFRPHRLRGDSWWSLACCYKQGGEPLITGLPFSNKEWKKSWFVVTGDWGKDIQLGGRQ